MATMNRSALNLLFIVALFFVAPANGFAQVTAKQALKLNPVQRLSVEISIPSADEIDDCTISSPTSKNVSGWIVKDAANRVLRRFLDTNGDNDIDLWCYYKDGFEVYRDIDSNFDRKADQYRWFGSQGTRWGVDENQDGKIDRWKRISAEEVSSEVAAAIGTGDTARFDRLMITAKELEQVGFGEDRKQAISSNLVKSKKTFASLLKGSGAKLGNAEWVHFGGLRPGIIPEGTDGADKDIEIYENVAALLRTGDDDLQISLGTMVKSGDCWRMIDAPELIDEKSTASFASWYRSSDSDTADAVVGPGGDANYQKLLASFDELDRDVSGARTASEKKKAYDKMADTISRLALEAEEEVDSLNWSRQFADSITAAFQSGDYPIGLEKLNEFATELKQSKKSSEAVALVTYRYINADFGAKLNDSKVDIADAQSDWLIALEKFTEDYPKDENTPDAMMQLAMADEFEGEKENAGKWYRKVSTDFSESQFAEKASGAIKRLNSIGTKMPLTGNMISGGKFDIGELKGKVVLVHYWADWCELCKDEFDALNKLQKEYPDDLVLVGVNCDNDLDTAKKAVRSTGVAWTQLFSEGGYNSGLAAEMGIVSLPTMILVDKDGEIVSTTISASGLERELKSLLK